MDEINTKEALAALPAGTVLREKNGDIGEWDGTVLAGTDGGWWGLDYVVAAFPLTVLYRPDQPGGLTDREREVFIKLVQFVDRGHWYESDDCHPVRGDDCSPYCGACEVLRHVDDQLLREAREVGGYARP
jgi:hypothetical protein